MLGIIVKIHKLIEKIMAMIKHVNGYDISRSYTVNVRLNAGLSTHDLMNYTKPAIRKKPKALVIHASTNDIQQEIDAMKMVKKLAKLIKEIDSDK